MKYSKEKAIEKVVYRDSAVHTALRCCLVLIIFFNLSIIRQLNFPTVSTPLNQKIITGYLYLILSYIPGYVTNPYVRYYIIYKTHLLTNLIILLRNATTDILFYHVTYRGYLIYISFRLFHIVWVILQFVGQGSIAFRRRQSFDKVEHLQSYLVIIIATYYYLAI